MTEAIARAVAGRVFAIVALACLSTVSPAGAGTITYGYDALGRVVSATFSNGVVATYQYDAAGNRTLFSTTAAPAPAPVAGAVSATVAYNSANNSITSKLSGGAATSVAPSPAPHGAVTVSGLNFLYAPTNGYFGADNFTYTASNSGGTSAPATVSITVSAPPAMVVTIGGGASASGHSASHAFATSTATVTGGSGWFTYLWSNTNDGFGTWTTGGTGSSFAPSVSGVAPSCGSSSATYSVTVTDTVTHQTKTSSGAAYTWMNSSGIC